MSVTPTQKFLTASGAKVVERIDVPPRAVRRKKAPARYRTGLMAGWLEAMTGSKDMVWRHQALALDAVASGENVVLATGTASGKSLVFQAAVVHELLNGDGRALLMFPQKALGSDQLHRAQRALELAGLDPALVGVVHGDVANAERDRILNECRIVLATPDVIHCWMMRQLASPLVQAFLSQLRHVVIDEAHVLEGVFGSNGAYFLRRLRAGHERAHVGMGGVYQPLQFIAATATIKDPGQHLLDLTGCEFTVIDETENGAPFHGLTLLHIEGPGHGGPAERMAADIGSALAEVIGPDALIMFYDGRQGVERITRTIDREDVLPYRGGYDGEDRRKIEQKLRLNQAVGIISTSALELGIDIPQFTIGLNVGVPQTRKAFRQRVGRIGRNAPGVFVLMAPPSAFAQLGSSFREFYEGEAEPSHLYLGNRFIQFQQARCLIDEQQLADSQADTSGQWPDGFAEMVAAAQPGARRPADLEQIAQLGSDSPHFAYPLRNICEVSYALKSKRNLNEPIGKIELDKALREAYPGAIYHHLKKAHRVIEWRSTSYEHSIILEPVKAAAPTQPLSRTCVSVSTDKAELIDGRLLAGEHGLLAEISLRVTDSVEGYRSGSTQFSYRDLQSNDRRMRRRYREFGTTGVLVRINEPWFSGSGDAAIKMRLQVAEALHAVLAREHNIAPAELRSVHQNVSNYSSGVGRQIDDAIVIFDNVVGGLRLSAPLFDDFPGVLTRLVRAANLAGDEALLDQACVERLQHWFASLRPEAGVEAASPAVGNCELLIFAPRSEVCVNLAGSLVDRTLLEPQLLPMGDKDILMYRYEERPGCTAFVPHDRIQPVGNNWRHAIWNPVSNEIREIAA